MRFATASSSLTQTPSAKFFVAHAATLLLNNPEHRTMVDKAVTGHALQELSIDPDISRDVSAARRTPDNL
jgi:hypothetical protein